LIWRTKDREGEGEEGREKGIKEESQRMLKDDDMLQGIK
jgi:hypothetical protein